VVSQLDQSGTCLWSVALPASTTVALDPSENVLLATLFSGAVDFGGGPLTSVGTTDLAVAKLDPTGAYLWSHSFGASGATLGAIDAFGALDTGGAGLAVGLQGAVDFGCGAVSSSPAADTLLANFDATGTVVFSRVVQLAGRGSMVVDGLGGISTAVQMGNGIDCACTTDADCSAYQGTCFEGTCFGGTCETDEMYTPGPIWITRFAP
jgi:outer membrane protein assembly factor BamB